MRLLLSLFCATPLLFTSAFAQADPGNAIGHGVNLGNMLEAPHEGAWGVSVKDEYFPIIKQAGFTVVRVPIRWSAHVSSAPTSRSSPFASSRSASRENENEAGRVLEEAAEDIELARDFYEVQEQGIGDYCVDSLVAEIEKLETLHGIHAKHFGFYRMLAPDFRSESTIGRQKT